jgi:hypothetical protein
MNRLALAVAFAAVAGCGLEEAKEEADLKAQFTPITTRQEFIDIAVGPQWQSDEIVASFAPDGGLIGEINGVPVTGSWDWQNGQFCMDFRVATSGGTGCSTLGHRADEILVTPLGGRGAPYSYHRI